LENAHTNIVTKYYPDPTLFIMLFYLQTGTGQYQKKEWGPLFLYTPGENQDTPQKVALRFLPSIFYG